MSRSRDNRRRKARARRRLRLWKRRRIWGRSGYVIDDVIRSPNDPTKVRSFVEAIAPWIAPYLATCGDSRAVVLVKHTESGRVRTEDIIEYLTSPPATLDHD